MFDRPKLLMKCMHSVALLMAITHAGYSQCTVSATLNTTNYCNGAQLNVNTGSTLSELIWYKDGIAIQRTDATTYTSKLIAGGNGTGNAPDQFDYPNGIFMDASGNLYVSDGDNYRVQKFIPGSTSGVTVAGGNGSGSASNQLHFPRGLYVDAGGNIYVADDHNDRIQKWAPGATSGVTIAGGNGTGSAANQLSIPAGIFVDAAGNLYIGDQYNNRVQKWAPGATSGITVAGGNGQGAAANQLSGAISVFVDASGNVFVADQDNARIQEWTPGATTGITVAGGNGAGSAANQLYDPISVIVDAAGNIYIADYINDRVQKWPPGATSGITVAGGSLPNNTGVYFGRPSTLYVDASGNIYITVTASNSIQEWGTLYTPVTSSFTAYAAGTYYAVVSDNNNCSVTTNAVIIGPTVTPTVLISAPDTAIHYCSQTVFTATPLNGGASPSYSWQRNGVPAGTNSPVYVANDISDATVIRCVMAVSNLCTTAASVVSNDIIMKVSPTAPVNINPKTGYCLGDSILLHTDNPVSQIIWSNNNIPVQTIQAMPAGTNIIVAGGNGPGAGNNQFATITGIGFDAQGDLYVCDWNNNRIQEWKSGATSGITVAGGNGTGSAANQLIGPSDLFVDPAGNIYVLDAGNERVQKFTPGNPAGITVAGGNGIGTNLNQFENPAALYVNASGNIYVADRGDRIVEWTPGANTGILVAGGNNIGPNANQLYYPSGVFVDASGNIYVADWQNARVQKWAPGATSGITVAGGNGPGPAPNQLYLPTDVYVDADGNIFVADAGYNRIQEWKPGAIAGITVATGDLPPYDYGNSTRMFFGANGTIYYSEAENEVVYQWSSKPVVDTIYQPVVPGIYTTSIMTSGGCLVAASNSITINPTIIPSVNISASANDICQGSIINFNAVPANGGTNPSFQWQVNGLHTGSNLPSFSDGNLSDHDVVTCKMQNNESCVIPDSALSNPINIHVIVPLVPSVNITAVDTTLCAGSVASLMALPVNGGSAPTFQWMVNGVPAGTNNQQYSSNNFSDGDLITCQVTSSSTCLVHATANSNTIRFHVKSNLVPQVNIKSSSDQSCAGVSVQFEASINNSGTDPQYQWQINGVNEGPNAEIFNSNQLSDGDMISCIVTNDASCAAGTSNTIRANINPLPVIAPGQSFVYTPGQTLTLDPQISGDIIQYIWSPASGLSNDTIRNPLASPTKTTNYQLDVVSSEGCTATERVIVKVFTKFSVPNAFTPNGDGKNDVFYILGGLAGATVENFSVFDRWGERVFQANNVTPGDPSFGWNGYFRGQPALAATYVYIITVKLENNNTEVYRGSVILIR